jgi:DNA-binding MarR family transcriptional regulator
MKIALKNSIAFKINKIANQVNSTFNQMLQPFDIALEQRVTLDIIKHEKDITLTKISHILSKDKTTISRTLRTLEKKGFIQKNDNSKDKRVSFIELTKRGEEVLSDTEEITNSFRNALLSEMDNDEAQKLFELLDKVTLGLKEKSR